MTVRANGMTAGEKQIVYELTLSAQVFDDYGRLHRDKGTPEGNRKAKRNEDRAASCRRALKVFNDEGIVRFPGDDWRQIYWAARHYPRAWLHTAIFGGIIGFALGCAVVLITQILK